MFLGLHLYQVADVVIEAVYRINSQGLLEAEIHLSGGGSIELITGTLLCSSQWMHEVHQPS